MYVDADGDDGMVDNPVYIGGGRPDNDARSQDPSAFMVTNPAYVSSAAQSLSHKPTTRHRAASVLFEPRGETDTDSDQKALHPAPSHLMVSQRAPHSRLLWLVAGAAFVLAAVALAVGVSESRANHSKMADMMNRIADLEATVASLLDTKMGHEETAALIASAMAPLQHDIDVKANWTAVDSLRMAVDAQETMFNTTFNSLQGETQRLAEQILPWPALDSPAVHLLNVDYLHETRTNTIVRAKARFPLPPRLLSGDAALRIQGHIHARAGDLDTSQILLIDCFDKLGVRIEAQQVYRFIDTATSVLAASDDGTSLTLARPADLHEWENANMRYHAVALYIGPTTRPPAFISSPVETPGDFHATVVVDTSLITVTFSQTLPQDVLAAVVTGSMTAVVHTRNSIYVYPVYLPVSANQEADVSFDVAVSGSCFGYDPGCNARLSFRPETAFFEFGFRLNYQNAGEATVTGLRVQMEDT